jgi:hypothetical protein
MNRYSVDQFDGDTFIVVDRVERREICICGNYQRGMDARRRALVIAALLNLPYAMRTRSRGGCVADQTVKRP